MNGTYVLPYTISFSAIVSVKSGLPVDPQAGTDLNGDGFTTDRPGTLARNSFRLPASKTVDLSFAKSLTLAGPHQFEVRMDVFNAAGGLVFTLRSYAGDPAQSGHVYLAAGTYTVRFTALAPSGAQLPNVAFLLSTRVISDPIGPRTDDGSGSASPVTPWDGSTGTTTDPNWDQPYYW